MDWQMFLYTARTRVLYNVLIATKVITSTNIQLSVFVQHYGQMYQQIFMKFLG